MSRRTIANGLRFFGHLPKVFQLFLGVVQAAVDAAFGQQGLVFSLLGDAAAVHDVDAVAVHHIGQAVGDEDDRFLPRQLADGRHDVVFTLGVHVGGGFVEEVDGRVVQQRTGHGQTLALTAGQV